MTPAVTREIKEEKLEFKDAIYTCIETFLSLEPEIKNFVDKKNQIICSQIHEKCF